MALNLTNWITGNLTVVITSVAFPDGYQLKTCQLVDPSMDPRIDQIDTITKHRVGYLDRPTLISLTLGLIASQDDGSDLSGAAAVSSVRDFEALSKLHYALINPAHASPTEGFFTLTVSDPVNFSGHFEFYSCVVTSSNPANVVVENVPVSTWNILALDAEYIRTGSEIGNSEQLHGGPRVGP